MKTIFSSTCAFGIGVYLLWLTIAEWMSDQTITVFVKAYPDITFSADTIWMGMVVNGSLSLALILGAVGGALMLLTPRNLELLPVVCLSTAGLLFLNFLLFYIIALLFFY